MGRGRDAVSVRYWTRVVVAVVDDHLHLDHQQTQLERRMQREGNGRGNVGCSCRSLPVSSGQPLSFETTAQEITTNSTLSTREGGRRKQGCMLAVDLGSIQDICSIGGRRDAGICSILDPVFLLIVYILTVSKQHED